MMLVHEGLPEGKCCTITYDARSRGIARGGNVARLHYDAVHEGLPEGKMLHGKI